jgi:hypothetical protein
MMHWHVVSVPNPVGKLVPLLLGSSMTEGVVSYPWIFQRTSLDPA